MKVRTSFREAIEDDRLLGKALPGESWHAWRSLLLACMGEELTADELETFREVTGRDTAPTERCEELVAIVGRRGGKSRAVAVLATYLATLIDHSDVLAKGERGLLLCIAPDVKQASIVHGYVQGVLEESELLSHLVENQTRTELRLTNGVDLAVRAANWRRLRGVTCIGAILDESAFFYSDEGSANADRAILDAVRPSLATTHGLLAIISTPYARRGATWEAFSRHFGPEGDPAILVANGASRIFNPALDERLIARAYERDPVAAAAEYGGEWRSDIAAFLSRDAVAACVDRGVHERPYCGGAHYVAHVDPSGGSNDSFALAIAHKEGDRAVLDVVREVRQPFSPESVVAEFCELLQRYQIKHVTGDRFGGEWPREQFRKRGVQYRLADAPASQMFVEALPLINAGTARLLDNRRLIDQFVNLERRTSFSGKDTIGHPPGAHDDIAVRVSGALLNASKPEPRCRTYGVPFWSSPRTRRRTERTRVKIVRIPEMRN